MAKPLGSRTAGTMTDTETAWVAGLLEGEGSFLAVGRPEAPKRPRVSMQSTDLDVLTRLRDTTGVGTIHQIRSRPNRKPCWGWSVQRYGDAVWLMDAVYDLMGERRRCQIDTARGRL